MKTAAFITFGCKINQYETEAIREEVLSLGYEEVSPVSVADVYVVNTCAVTAASGVKSRSAVRRVARRNPASKILVVGCSTPSEKERLSAIPQVALLAGNEEKSLVASFLNGGWKPGEPIAAKERDIFNLSISRYGNRTRANIKVQDGCNSFCSFCIIPFLRGRSKSRHPAAVVEEVRRLAEAGYREVVITGVHLQDYGLDMSPSGSLPELLSRVAGVSGIERIRMSSLGVKSFTKELVDVFANPIFCPHWHIPLQAGSDDVLKGMRRDYSVGQFRDVVAILRAKFDDPSISTDVIVGHPGETDAHFDETLRVCRELAFSKIHIFPYSVREGTLAAKLGGFNAPLEIRRRAQVVAELEAELGLAYKKKLLGTTVDDVLVENVKSSGAGAGAEGGDAPAELEGTTARHVKVRFPAPSPRAAERFRGSLQPVRIEAVEPTLARGVWAGEMEPSASARGGE
jgi:threonylcarbamoyladenosine tRNA methylthiotransferase MtaB